MNQLTTCQICQSSETKIIKRCRDHLVSKKTFGIRQCAHCLFEWTDPQPSKKRIKKYYKSKKYISHSDCKLNLNDWIYHIARSVAKHKKRNIVGKGKGLLVEIGCGTGSLLKYCQELGWRVVGIETNHKARKTSKLKHGLVLKKSLANANLSENSINTIMLWHVFEHLYDPNGIITKLERLLIEEGRIIIAAPNSRANEIDIYNEGWAAYDVPRHLYHYSKENMQQIAKNNGFEISKIVPLWFDAYYISILSEQMNDNRFAFVKGLLVGTWSNLKAWLFNKEFSSIVYVLTKKQT